MNGGALHRVAEKGVGNWWPEKTTPVHRSQEGGIVGYIEVRRASFGDGFPEES